MAFAGLMSTSDRRHGSSGEMYANQRHIVGYDYKFGYGGLI